MELKNLTAKQFLILALACAVIFFGVFNSSIIWQALGRIINLLQPFLIGCAIAFVLNVPLRFFEKRVFRLNPDKKVKSKHRALSIVLSIAAICAGMTILVMVIVPQLIDSVTLLISYVPDYLHQLSVLLGKLPDESGTIKKYITEINSISPQKIESTLSGFVSSGFGGNADVIGSALLSTVGFFSSIFTRIVNFVIAFVFAIYILMSKETLAIQARKMCYAFMPPAQAHYFIHVCQVSFAKFYSFITGQLMEAVILGTLCTIGMVIFRFPYALMIGVLTGFCALIPVVGAFIGGAVGALLILTVSPMKALGFLVFLMCLQQIEGNVIYPKVVGSSVGLPSMWTLFAITTGAVLMGLVGILLFVPLCAVIYYLIAETVHARLKFKNINETNQIILNGIDEDYRL